MGTQKRVFSYEQALELLPEVQRITGSAVSELTTALSDLGDGSPDVSPESSPGYQEIVSEWARSMMELGIEVKGLWLIDFDNGSGYYCWRYPEESLEYFHGYEEGFAGRVKLN